MRRDDPAALSAELYADMTKEKQRSTQEKRPDETYEEFDDIQVDPNTSWLVEGLIGEGGLAAVYGKTNLGKSAWAVDLACNVATGTNWRNRQVLQGYVGYVASESPRSIRHRVVGWRDHRLPKPRTGRVPLIVRKAPVMLTNAVEVETLAEELRQRATAEGVPWRLVVVDTLATSMIGDENGSDMTAAVNGANRLRELLKCAVLVVHHPGKDETRGLRGNSSLPGALDTVLHLTDGQVKVEKQREGGAIGECFAFELEIVELGADSKGKLITTVVVKHLEDGESRFRKAKPRGLQPTAKMGFQALEEAILQYGEPMGVGSSTIPSGVRAVRIDDWRRQYYLRIGRDTGETKDETAKKQFQRARLQLAAGGHVGMSDPWAWVNK